MKQESDFWKSLSDFNSKLLELLLPLLAAFLIVAFGCLVVKAVRKTAQYQVSTQIEQPKQCDCYASTPK